MSLSPFQHQPSLVVRIMFKIFSMCRSLALEERQLASKRKRLQTHEFSMRVSEEACRELKGVKSGLTASERDRIEGRL